MLRRRHEGRQSGRCCHCAVLCDAMRSYLGDGRRRKSTDGRGHTRASMSPPARAGSGRASHLLLLPPLLPRDYRPTSSSTPHIREETPPRMFTRVQQALFGLPFLSATMKHTYQGPTTQTAIQAMSASSSASGSGSGLETATVANGCFWGGLLAGISHSLDLIVD